MTQNSEVEINCTTDSMKPFWSVDLANDSVKTTLQFGTRKEELNNHGLFDISSLEIPALLKLFINDTLRNNQTALQCTGQQEVYQTILFVYGMLYITQS